MISEKIKQRNNRFLIESKERLYDTFRTRKFWKTEARGIIGDPDHYYDDDITQTISEEFTDRISILHLIGDIIRALGGLLGKRKKFSVSEFYNQTINHLLNDKKTSRKDVACFTEIEKVSGNKITPFMNGGPLGEHWNTAENGFYESIQNSKKSIIGVELGFKADEYGLEVKKRLIKAKKDNPDMYVGLLIDGFVSIIMQDSNPFDDFKVNTKKMIKEMLDAKIDVRINDSWNPASLDFLAANHIKLWIFDGKAAFVGGIGIESQFIKELYDQMDRIEGHFVRTLTLMTFFLFANQKKISDQSDDIEQIYEMIKNDRDKIDEKFLPKLKDEDDVTLELSMNVPGYVQDAQIDYYNLLLHKDISEIYIMAPYFSDDKIARALVKTASKLEKKEYKKIKEQIKNDNPELSENELKASVHEQLEKNKKVHIIFPKKHENVIIAEISKYYSYLMRENKIVETKQFCAKKDGHIHEMLHAKQMVVVLERKGWKKYVKFGGSYNPAGRAHNMWELNTTAYYGKWGQSDEGLDNPIKNYLENIIKVDLNQNTEPFPWGDVTYKISIFERFIMKLSQMLFF